MPFKKDKQNKPEINSMLEHAPPVARPRDRIDWEIAEELASYHTTQKEIAQYFGVSEDTFAREHKKRYGCGFADKKTFFRSRGRAWLRMVLWRKALYGDDKALKQLAEKYLKLSEKVEVKHQFEPIAFQVVTSNSQAENLIGDTEAEGGGGLDA